MYHQFLAMLMHFYVASWKVGGPGSSDTNTEVGWVQILYTTYGAFLKTILPKWPLAACLQYCTLYRGQCSVPFRTIHRGHLCSLGEALDNYCSAPKLYLGIFSRHYLVLGGTLGQCYSKALWLFSVQHWKGGRQESVIPQQVVSCWCRASTEACSDVCICEVCSSATAESPPGTEMYSWFAGMPRDSCTQNDSMATSK